MRISHFLKNSHVDGPGQRAVLFVQGCTLACAGCQNQHLWPATGGIDLPIDIIAETLALSTHNGNGITITGGEPMQQPGELAALMAALARHALTDIIIYTGYDWDELPDVVPAPLLRTILKHTKTIVVGRFVRELDHDYLQYRGSSNQRVIDVPASVIGQPPVLRDWDTPEIIITPTGDLLTAMGLITPIDLGQPLRTRRCGQADFFTHKLDSENIR